LVAMSLENKKPWLTFFAQSNFPVSGDIQVGYITFDVSLSVNYSDLNPRISELTGFIAKELGVNISQVHVLNVTSAGNGSLISYAVYPEESAEYFSNTTATHIISLLAEHNVQLPDFFSSYKLVGWKFHPPLKRTWWEQYYVVVIMAVIGTLMLGLLAYGIWYIWRRRQETSIPYKPVDTQSGPPQEQELQPLSIAT
ncbi:hypothetical protein KSS87_013169, partial [Heliosperma pusillum]